MFTRCSSNIAAFALFLPYAVHIALAQNLILDDSGATISEEQFNATWTHLSGYEGCDLTRQYYINQAFWDAAAILNRGDVVNTHPGNTGINWNGAAAVEYLGAPFSNPVRESIQSR